MAERGNEPGKERPRKRRCDPRFWNVLGVQNYPHWYFSLITYDVNYKIKDRGEVRVAREPRICDPLREKQSRKGKTNEL